MQQFPSLSFLLNRSHQHWRSGMNFHVTLNVFFDWYLYAQNSEIIHRPQLPFCVLLVTDKVNWKYFCQLNFTRMLLPTLCKRNAHFVAVRQSVIDGLGFFSYFTERNVGEPLRYFTFFIFVRIIKMYKKTTNTTKQYIIWAWLCGFFSLCCR